MSERSHVNPEDAGGSRKDRRVATRERILDAADRVVRAQGVIAATTKRIAAEAGLAEGSLYNHFPDKARLLIHLVLERMPGIRQVFARLEADVERRSLEECLTTALTEMIAFYSEALPILGGISADPNLLRLCRISFVESGGPQRAHEKLAAILANEQARGRMKPDTDPQVLAFLLISSCTEYATLARLLGPSPMGLTAEAHVNKVIAALRPLLSKPDDPVSTLSV